MAAEGEMVFIQNTMEDEWVELELDVSPGEDDEDEDEERREDKERRGDEDEQKREDEDEERREDEDEDEERREDEDEDEDDDRWMIAEDEPTPSQSSSTRSSTILDTDEEDSNPFPTSSRSQRPDKRKCHNKAERERRGELQVLFNELKSVMGLELSGQRWSKVETLNKAHLVIKDLVLKETSLELTTEILIFENFRLQRRLDMIKKRKVAPCDSPTS